MDAHVMLVCCYRDMNATIKFQFSFRFDDLVNCVCQNFDGLTHADVCFFFKIPGYSCFKLQNDVDMENMVSLARSFRLRHIDIVIETLVTQSSNSIGNPNRKPRNVIFSSLGEGYESDDDDEQNDLLPKFCPRVDKVFMSAPWANGITHVGQSFEDGAAKFRNVLRKYAVECGFRFKYVKNDSVRIIAVCMMRESKGYMWSIHARVLHADEFFYIHKWNIEHSCSVAIRTPKNLRAGSDLVSDVISELVHDKPLTRPSDVVYNLKKDYGLEISYRVAWLDVKKARGEMFGAHSISFDQLRWYSNSVMENNPGSYINIDYNDQNHRFKRYFISFKACIDGFNHCRPLLFLDGTFLKGKFKGNLLDATSKDINQGLFLLAIAIVDSENTTNWAWFLEHLVNVVKTDKTITFISDRHTGVLESIPTTFPYAHQAFCLQHLQWNLQDKIRYTNKMHRVDLLSRFRECAYASTITTFNSSIERFKISGRQVATAFLGDRYGEICSNVAESFNSWIREALHLPITQMVDSIRMKIMDQMSKRQRKWQIKRFPYAHAMVAIRNSRRDLNDLVEPYYHMSKYRSIYASSITPILTVEKPPFNTEDFIIHPPIMKRPPGRPKKK
ncbi:uncharacterized protein LOC114272493 [Camellia sinensis]|uniref:uncharacterized protein LOC114272493 n=1 Tax=Camellia sinensis TaxID=4442 RepID=UPI001036E215|nr:uncharacterized protein LOC114272493 [Camellia sinensis]